MEKIATSTLEVKEEVSERRPKSGSKSKEKKRSEKRNENFRATASQKSDSNAKQALYDKLYYGFRQQNEAIKSMQFITTPRSVILPISTRSVGFMVRFLVCKFARLNIRNVECHLLCSALYRVTLLQMDIKLMQAMRNQFSRNIGVGEFARINIDPEFVRIVCELGAYFSPLVNLISAVGVVKAFGAQFIPRMLKPTVIEHVHSFDPTIVAFSTLRSYVTALASTATPYDVRKYFYDHTPFPNARWRLQERVHGDDIDQTFPVLINADEIMPAIYDTTTLSRDIDVIMDSIELITRKFEKFTHVGGIDFGGNGDYTMLPSNTVESVRCADLSWAGNEPVYRMYNSLEGTIDFFWSNEHISDPEFQLGALHLFGEMPRKGVDISSFGKRLLSGAKQEANVDYAAGIQNLLG